MNPEEIYLRRSRLNLTREQLGELFGVTGHTIKRYEHGKTPPPNYIDRALTFIELEPMLNSESIERLDAQLPDAVSLPRCIRHTPRALKDNEEKIRALLAAHPDISLRVLCEEVKADSGVSVSRPTMSRELKRLGISLSRTGPLVRTSIQKPDDEIMIRTVAESHPNASLPDLCAALIDIGGPTISPQTMSRVLKRLKLRNPNQGPGPKRVLADYREEICATVAAYPTASLTELCELVEATGGPKVSHCTMVRELKRLKLQSADTGSV